MTDLIDYIENLRNVGDMRRADTVREAFKIARAYKAAGFTTDFEKLGDGYLITATGRDDE